MAQKGPDGQNNTITGEADAASGASFAARAREVTPAEKSEDEGEEPESLAASTVE